MINPKKLVGEKAAEYVKNGMKVGLGTGSTASFAIEAIGSMVKQGLKVLASPRRLPRNNWPIPYPFPSWRNTRLTGWT